MTDSISNKRIKIVEEVISNEDLLLQVLLWLPAKSLIRFKCVSKNWFSIISDPKFCSKHTLLNPTSPTLGVYFVYKDVYMKKNGSLHQTDRKRLPTLAHIKNALPGHGSDQPMILHACNGLFLCSYSPKMPYLVCNFTTQTFTVLPQHPRPACDFFPTYNFAHLVFDPSKTQHFKVVLLHATLGRHDMIFHHEDEFKGKSGYCTGGYCYEIDVYSSDNGVWKRMYFRAKYGLDRSNYRAACDGSLHLLTKSKYHVRFDVDTTTLIFNPLPSKPKTLDIKKVRYFGESYGHLFLICLLRRNPEMFNVLELDKDQSIWKMKYRVNMRPLMASFPESFQRPKNSYDAFTWNFTVLCVTKEENINGYVLLLAIPGKIISYNLRRNTFKVVDELSEQEYPPINRHYYNSHAFPFMASLSLV